MSADHGDRRHQVLAAAIGFFIPSFVVVCLRVYVRYVTISPLRQTPLTKSRLSKPAGLGTDDWLMLATMVFTTTYITLQITSAHYGNGAHRSSLTPSSASTATELWFLCGLTYEPATVLLKLSISSFLHRFTTQRWQTILLRILSIILILFGLTYWFFLLFQCKPISLFWAPGPGKCISATAFIDVGYGAAALNAAADALYAALPLAIIYRSSWRQSAKVTVCVLLGLGSLAAVATVARAALAYTTEDVYSHSDFLFSAVPVAVLSTAELGIGITAASAGTLRPLFEGLLRPKKKKRAVQRQQWLDRVVDQEVGRLGLSDKSCRIQGSVVTITGVEELGQMPDLVFAAMTEMEKSESLALTVDEAGRLEKETESHSGNDVVVDESSGTRISS